ncbi:MAG: diguanylate cyclase [Caldisericia bacterium]|nr:diguanylate cyclase [Caldisericia bacterium]
MKLIYTKDELIELENQIFELKILIPIFGLLIYLSSIFFKFTKYPLTPFFYISVFYILILISMHYLFKKIKEEKFLHLYFLISIIEIIFATILIYYSGGITSSLFVLYLIIILSISTFRVPNIVFIFSSLSYLSYLILVFGEYFGILKYLDYFTSENIEITLPFLYQRSIMIGLYIFLFSLFANRIIIELNRDKRVQDLLREGALLLTSYIGEREKFLKSILKIARELVQGDTASIIEYKDGEYKFISWDNIKDEDIKEIEEGFKKSKPKNLEIIRETKSSLKFDDVWKVPYWIKVINLRSYIGVPIVFKDKVVAILNVDSRKINKFKDRDVRYLETFSKIISTIYEKDELVKEIKELNLKLESLSITEPLTNLYNRRKVEEVILYNIEIFFRKKENFQLIMIDIDNFKKINDNLGHLEGDNFLIKFGEILKNNLRKIDYIIRYGGDEFLLILPNTPPPTVEVVIERINSLFKKEFEIFVKNYDIGISYGSLSFVDYISQFEIDTSKIDKRVIYENILKEVDKLLYYSKKLKRAT